MREDDRYVKGIFKTHMMGWMEGTQHTPLPPFGLKGVLFWKRLSTVPTWRATKHQHCDDGPSFRKLRDSRKMSRLMVIGLLERGQFASTLGMNIYTAMDFTIFTYL